MDEDHFDGAGESISVFEYRRHEGTVVQGDIEEDGCEVTDQHTEPIRPHNQPDCATDAVTMRKLRHVTTTETGLDTIRSSGKTLRSLEDPEEFQSLPRDIKT